jgi:hypothetical protein
MSQRWVATGSDMRGSTQVSELEQLIRINPVHSSRAEGGSVASGPVINNCYIVTQLRIKTGLCP